MHVFNFLLLDPLKVVLSHLLVDVECFFELGAITLGFFADRSALLTEIVIHFGGIDTFFEAATRCAAFLATLTAVFGGACTRSALELTLLHTVLDLVIDDWFAI
jgi:hypothetical protein